MTLKFFLLFCLVAVTNNHVTLSNARTLKNSPNEKQVIKDEQNKGNQVDPSKNNNVKVDKKQLGDFPFPFPFSPFPFPPAMPIPGIPGFPRPRIPFGGIPYWVPPLPIPSYPLPPFPPLDIPGIVPSTPLPPLNIPSIVPSAPLPSP